MVPYQPPGPPQQYSYEKPPGGYGPPAAPQHSYGPPPTQQAVVVQQGEDKKHGKFGKIGGQVSLRGHLCGLPKNLSLALPRLLAQEDILAGPHAVERSLKLGHAAVNGAGFGFGASIASEMVHKSESGHQLSST